MLEYGRYVGGSRLFPFIGRTGEHNRNFTSDGDSVSPASSTRINWDLAWNVDASKWQQSIDYEHFKMVEAGGVEPPSEKRYGPKPTCLAQFALVRQPRSE